MHNHPGPVCHLIGLTGFAGAGKDTIADLLVTHAGFHKLAFADSLRAEVAEAFSIEMLYLTHPSTKHEAIPALAMRRAPRDFLAAVCLSLTQATTDHRPVLSDAWLDAPRSPRQIMQWWGTEYRRAQDPRYWTRALVSRLMEYRRWGYARHVITDVRFDNEADVVRAANGAIWQVTRPNKTGQAEGTHISATDGARFQPDVVIANTHDVRHLQGLVMSEWSTLSLGLPRGSVRIDTQATTAPTSGAQA